MATAPVAPAIGYKSHFYIGDAMRSLALRLSAVHSKTAVFDTDWGGDHKLYGTTKVQISETEKTPTDVAVVVLDGISFLPVRKVWSKNGVWRVEHIKAGRYLITAIDHNGNHNAVSWGIQPSVPMGEPENSNPSN